MTTSQPAYINQDGNPYADDWLGIWSYAYEAAKAVDPNEDAAAVAADEYLALAEAALAAHA